MDRFPPLTLIFDASPLIVLGKAGLLEILIEVGCPSVIPRAVCDEILRGKDMNDPARRFLQSGAQSHLIPIPIPPALFVSKFNLGPGESAVLSHAIKTSGSIAVLDDLRARRCAKAASILHTGTLGLILLAKNRGLLSSVVPALDAITKAGLFVAPKQLSAIRAAAGE